jgi:hypothetical protein
MAGIALYALGFQNSEFRVTSLSLWKNSGAYSAADET